MGSRIFGPRQTIVGPGFSPAGLSAVTGWLRLDDRTDTGTLTIPDVLGGPSATQATEGSKPTFTTANGLPVAVFDGSDDHLLQAVASASNNNSPRCGFAAWVKPTLATGLRAVIGAGSLAPLSAGRLLFMQSAADLFLDVNIDAANVRRGTASGVFAAATWIFITFEYDGGQAAENHKCVITTNADAETLSFSNSAGTGAMPTTLVQPTGSQLIGIQRVTTPLRGWNGQMGPNFYWLGGAGGISGGGLLTREQRIALANFDNPTGTPLS